MPELFLFLSLLCLKTACADGVIRVFKLDDASSKSFKYAIKVSWIISICQQQFRDSIGSLSFCPQIM